MKVKVNLSNQTLEYMDSQPYIQGTDTRNVLNVYIEHEDNEVSNIMIAYALQNGRTTIKMANTGATQETIDETLYDVYYFTAPKVLTSISGNFVATIIIDVNTSVVGRVNTYKVNVLNTVLNAVDFEAFEDALDDTASEVLESLESMAGNITYLQSQVVGVLHNTDIVDNDTSNDPTKVLSARMGKVLAERIGATTSGLVSATYNESTGVLTLTYENDDTYEMKIGLSTTDKSNMADDVENVILADLFETFSTVKSYSVGDFVNYENNIYEFVSNKASGAWDSTKVVVANLNDYMDEVNAKLEQQDTQINNLIGGEPRYVNTSSNILALTSNQGVAVATDNGHWFYWDGEQYVDSGIPYQATEIADGSVNSNKTDFIDGVINVFNPNDSDNLIKKGYFIAADSYPNDYASANYAYCKCKIEPNTKYTIKARYYVFQVDENNNVVQYNVLPTSSLSTYTFTSHANAKYLFFNGYPASIDESMVVKGETYPITHYPYGEWYSFKGDQIYAKKSEVDDVTEIYYVGSGEQYTTFTACIRALANNTNKKIIYVKEGTYDIFNEIGGSAYALSITEGTLWEDCNDIIPTNTTIIGLGNVIFNFTPTAEQIGTIACTLLSPINIQGSVTLENIIINADNCRYCIHDETGDGFDNSVKYYKNVKCYKYRTGSIGNRQAYGNGFYKGVSITMENCYFESDVSVVSFHDRNYSGGNININNCVFISRSNNAGNVGIRFGNVAYSQKHHKVYINNSYTNSRIYINAENGNETINSYDLQVIGCNNPTIEIENVLTTNIYTPKVYN